jgi:integrase
MQHDEGQSGLVIPRLGDTFLEINKRTGRYEVRWTERVPGKPPRSRAWSTRTKDRHEAELARIEFCEGGAEIARAVNMPTVGELAAGYRAGHMEAKGIGPTQDWSLRPVEKHLGHVRIDRLDHSAVLAYQKTRRLTGVADGTVRRELSALRAVFGWSKKHKLLPAGFEIPYIDMPSDGQAVDRYLTKAEEDELFRLAVGHVGPDGRLSRVSRFILIALCTAARAESIERLTWDRVDFVNRTIDFREPGRRVTKKRRVMVPISDRLLPVLQVAYSERTQDKWVLDEPGSCRSAWETFRRDVWGREDITRHDLRRTWATLAAQAGVDMWQIAGVLGDTLETTTKHYAHHSPEHLRAAINKGK